MGTSTGGTLALQLAAAYPDIAGLVLLSPNIAINDPNAWLANNPWGLQIARLVKGSDYQITSDQRDIYKAHWYSKYRLEAIVNLQEYLETAMVPETFSKVKQPTLMLYYYKDEQHQDNVVKVSAMLDMMNKIKTPDSLKRAVAMPKTGDHVIASSITSEDWQGVMFSTIDFLENVAKVPARVAFQERVEEMAKANELLKEIQKD